SPCLPFFTIIRSALLWAGRPPESRPGHAEFAESAEQRMETVLLRSLREALYSDHSPFAQICATGKSLKKLALHRRARPPWSKAARQIAWRSLAFLEKVGEFLLEPAECS